MGRRSDHSIQELTHMIVEAAYNQIREEGFEKLSTRKIATRIGYTVGTLYNIFQNLDDIIIHVNNRTLEKLISDMKEASSSTGEESPMRRVASAYHKFSQENTNLWLVLFEYKFKENQDFPRWYKEKIDQIFLIVAHTLSLSVKGLNEDQLKEVVAVLWSGIHGICLLNNKGKLRRAGFTDIAPLLENFVDNYLAGIQAKH